MTGPGPVILPGEKPPGWAPPPGQVGIIKQPAYPHLRFEWHPQAQPKPDTPKGVVYVIRVGVLSDDKKELAEPFAWGIGDSGQALNAVQIWLRGYHHRELEETTSGIAEHKEKSRYEHLG